MHDDDRRLSITIFILVLVGEPRISSIRSLADLAGVWGGVGGVGFTLLFWAGPRHSAAPQKKYKAGKINLMPDAAGALTVTVVKEVLYTIIP